MTKRLTALILALVVGMVSRSAIAAPRSAIAELRAAICCAEHCPKDAPRPPLTSRRCCLVESAAGDPAGVTPTASLERPALVPHAVLSATRVLTPVRPLAARSFGALRRAGPPRYLQTLQIRC